MTIEEKKERKRISDKKYHEKNKEKRKEYNKQWREKNKEKRKEYNRQYQEENKEKIKSYLKEYGEKNIIKLKDYRKEYYIENKESILDKSKVIYQKNKEKYNEASRNFYKNNKTKVAEQKRCNSKIKYKNDSLYAVTIKVKNLIRCSLIKMGYEKKSRTHEILGCTYPEFKNHLEKQFEPWMNWENRGKYKKNEFNYGWDIDHVIPLSSATNEEELLKLNHYSNLQPLCSKINRDIKRNNLDWL